jgi:preprotein translocase subunit YajC
MPSLPAPLLSLEAAGGGLVQNLVMMGAFVAIFYFVMLRPQQQEQKAHAALVASLQKGDRVVTNAGVHARIHEARAETLVLEISPNAFLTVDRTAVARKVTDEAPKKDA